MKKILIITVLLLSNFFLVAQTYTFYNESKLTKQKKSDKWQSVLKYDNFTFDWCDKYPKTDSCFNIEKKYMLNKINDTIFIISANVNYKFKSHAQYPLIKSDTLLFSEENSEGLKNGSTIGNIIYIKDSIVTINKSKFDCYLFKRFSMHRDKGEIEFICMDKKTFIPITSSTFYIDLITNKIIKSAFQKRKLLSISYKKQ